MPNKVEQNQRKRDFDLEREGEHRERGSRSILPPKDTLTTDYYISAKTIYMYRSFHIMEGKQAGIGGKRNKVEGTLN